MRVSKFVIGGGFRVRGYLPTVGIDLVRFPNTKVLTT